MNEQGRISVSTIYTIFEDNMHSFMLFDKIINYTCSEIANDGLALKTTKQ